MALYDMYEEYQDKTLSEAEQAQLAEAREAAAGMEADRTLERRPGGFWNEREGFTPHPVVGAHMMIARERAQAQFKGNPPMPEDADVSIRFPGVDPVGKYSVIDMKFAQREMAVWAALESRPPEVQEYVKGLLDRRTSKKPADAAFSQRHFMMTQSAKTHRELTRGSKLCLDPDGRRLMHQQARSMEADLPVEQYGKLMQGIEYASGVRTGPVPKEITDFYKDTLKTELDLGLVAKAGDLDRVPAQIHVEFQDLDHKLLQQAFANPHNWGRAPAEIARLADSVDMDTVSGVLPAYAVATADRVIDPLFRHLEKEAPARFRTEDLVKRGVDIDVEFSRGDLISIDGRTIREIMQEQFTASGRTGSFADFYKQNARQMTNELVSAGLMAGKRVEAFVPDKLGQIPKEPTQITKTGYEPTPLKPEKFNAWQRHFAKRGFYKAKVARQAEYDRVMAARDRMRAKAASSEQARLEDRQARLTAAAARHASLNLTLPTFKTMFFGKIMDEMLPQLEAEMSEDDRGLDLRVFTTDSQGRTTREYTHAAFQAMALHANTIGAKGAFDHFTRSEPVQACVCMLAAQGHGIRDILDPNKLQAEREAVAREFMEHAKTNDQEWLGRTFYAGHQAVLQQLTEATRGVDLTDDRNVELLVDTEVLAHAAFGASQTLSQEGCKEGYLMAAAEALGGDLDRGSAMGEALNNKICDISLCEDYLVRGIKAQAALAAHPERCSPMDITELAAAKVIGESLRPGSSIAEQAPASKQLNRIYQAAILSVNDPEAPDSLRTIAETLLSPEHRAATARAAASGELVNSLNGQVRTPPELDPDGRQHVIMNDFTDRMVRQADGSVIKERTITPNPQVRILSSFALGKPAPEPQDPLLQAQAQKQTPQKQAPHKQPPKLGGMTR